VREAAAARAVIAADPAAAAAAEVGAKLPALVKVDDVVSAGATPVMDRLNQCVAAADQVIAFARTPEGAVRSRRRRAIFGRTIAPAAARAQPG
jgi:hypothetical protein